MGILVSKLEEIFRAQLDLTVQFHLGEVYPGAGRVGGYIVWPGFEDASQRERQSRVWNILRSELQPAELQQVSAVLTLSPNEEDAIMEREPVG